MSPPAVAAAATDTAPATAAATAETAASQSARRPSPTSGVGQSFGAGRAAGMGRAIAMHVLIFVAMYLLERWHEARQRERLEQLWEANVTPALEQRLTALGDAAWAAMLAGQRTRSVADITVLAAANLVAAAGNPALMAEAEARTAEIHGRAEAEHRYGTSAYLAARAAFEAALSARAAAARTHWTNDAARLNFVRAYAAVSSGASRDEALRYIAELDRPLPQAADPSLFERLPRGD